MHRSSPPSSSTEDFLLERPAHHRCDHAAHLFSDTPSQCEAVARYAGAAVDRGEAATLIVSASNQAMIIDALARGMEGGDGRDCAALRDAGRLVFLNADSTLRHIMRGDPAQPQRDGFSILEEQIAGLRSRFHGVAAYSELADLLWQQGDRRSACLIEEWCNDMVVRHRFSLLCAYRANLFDDPAAYGLEHICHAHTHVSSLLDEAHLDCALNTALREVFPYGDVEELRHAIGGQCRGNARLPTTHSVLIALHDLLPTLAHDVRLRARSHYARLARDSQSAREQPLTR